MSSPKKVVLAYSGGLDTSIILKWLDTEYGCEIVTFTADLGQGEELEPARKKAELLGVRAGEHLHRGPARDLRARLRLPDVPRQRRVRGPLPPRHLHRPPAASPSASSRSPRATGADAIAHGATGKGNDQVRFELSAYALDPPIRVIAPWREWNLTSPHQTARIRRGKPDPDRQGQARRGPLLGRRQPPAHLLRGQGAGEPRRGGPALRLPAHHRPRGRPRHPRIRRDRLRKGRPRQHRRHGNVPRYAPDPAQRARRPPRRRPPRPRREPLRRHEVPRHLRDPRRHHPPRRPPRHRVDHARPRRRPPQGRADAEIRRAHLQRLLVLPRARDAPGARSTAARSTSPAPCASSSTRAPPPSSAAPPRSRSTPRATSPSRTTPAPTTRRTPPASSRSTRCASACSGRATAGRSHRANDRDAAHDAVISLGCRPRSGCVPLPGGDFGRVGPG